MHPAAWLRGTEEMQILQPVDKQNQAVRGNVAQQHIIIHRYSELLLSPLVLVSWG